MSWLANNEFKGLNPDLLGRMHRAQSELDWIELASARDLIKVAANQLSLSEKAVDAVPAEMSAFYFGNLPHREIAELFTPIFPSGTSLADDLADQVQLCRAFDNPAAVLDTVTKRVISATRNFPHRADDLKIGDNRGDVLDPFILAANFELLSDRSMDRTVETSLSHKVLMKVEDLVGKLHETLIGAMRGNFSVPEPRRGLGGTKEVVQPYLNPFPGTDIGQVPTPDQPSAIRLFQVKNKTGSAKGGDGARLGRQLRLLEQTYGARTFFAAIVGNTLRGHRSMGAVLRESPHTAVLVGDAALRELARSQCGAELLLRTYRRAFRSASEQTGYNFDALALTVKATFQAEAKAAGTDFLDAWLKEAMGGPIAEQDSRHRSSE